MPADSLLSRTARTAASVGLGSAAAMTGALGQQAVANGPAKVDTIETVVVTARRSTLDLLPEKILNTPQAIDVIPAQVIKEQGTSSLQDALKNVPGITLNAGEGGTHGDLVNLRGFPAGDDYFLDGLRDTGLYTRDSFDYAAVEVYKGPASTLFGRGSTGGVINQVSKTPELFPIQDISVTGGTNSEMRLTGDFNYVTGDTSALRINVMGQRNNVEDRPFTRNQRWGIAPSFSTGIGADTKITLSYLHQQQDDIPDYGIPFLFGKPAPVPRNTFYGLPSDDRFKTDVDVVTAHVEHKVSDVFTMTDTARYGHYWFDSRQTAAIYGSANCYTSSPYSGAPVCAGTPNPVPVTTFNPLFPVLGTPLNQIFVQRDRPSSTGTIATMMNETDLSANFDTGIMVHHLVTGIQLDKEDATMTRFVNQNTVIAPTPLLSPNPYEAFPGTQTAVRQRPLTKTATIGVYAMDTVDIGEHWNVVAAMRFDHFGARFDQPVGSPSHFTHNDNIGSPRAAIVYKPTQDSSIYFSYGTSFNPSAESLSLAASNKDLGPERDRTLEIGAKAQVLDGLLSLTASAFNTVKTNARISDPLNPSLQSLAGTERVNGVEFGVNGHLSENWEVIAGYTYLAPYAVGLVAAGVPGPIPNTARDQGNVWTVYDLDSGWKFGTGLNYVGRRYAGTDTGTIPGSVLVPLVPSYITWDAMIGYKISDTLSLQLNGYNLTNAYYFTDSYFTKPGENHTNPGAGRTLLLTLNASL